MSPDGRLLNGRPSFVATLITHPGVPACQSHPDGNRLHGPPRRRVVLAEARWSRWLPISGAQTRFSFQFWQRPGARRRGAVVQWNAKRPMTNDE